MNDPKIPVPYQTEAETSRRAIHNLVEAVARLSAEKELLETALDELAAELNEAVEYAVSMREPWGYLRDMRNKARAVLQEVRGEQR